MTRSGRGLLRWLPRRGVTYVGRTTPGIVTEAIVESLRPWEFACTERTEDGGLCLDCSYRGSRWRMLRRALPARATWQIRAADNGAISIHRSFLLARWYGLVLIGLVCLIAAVLGAAVWTFDRSWTAETVWVSELTACLASCVVLLCLVVAHLFKAFQGGGAEDGVWRSIRRHVESRGGHLDALGIGADRRGYGLLLVPVVALAAFALWTLPETLSEQPGATPLMVKIWLLVILATALSLLGLVVLMLRVRGLAIRLTPALSGIAVWLAVLFFAAVPLPWLLSGWILNGITQAGTVDPRELTEQLQHPEMALFTRRFVQFLWSTVFFTVVFFGLAAGTLVVASRVAARAEPSLERFAARHPGDLEDAAVRSPRVVRGLRSTFLVIWIGLGVALATGAGTALVACACGGGWSSCPADFTGPARSGELLPLVFGRRVGDPTVVAVTRVAWVLYGLVVLAPFALSLGQLFRERRALRRRLAKQACSLRPEWLERAVEALTPKSGSWAFQVAVHPSDIPWATSHSFGLVRPDRYIAVTAGLLEVLPPAQVEAVLGHEVAHHLLGHCRTDALLRWLARTTLTGDGLARVLQHSLGYELDADAYARDELGVPAKDLLASLLTIRDALELHRRGERGLPSQGIPAVAPCPDPAECTAGEPAPGRGLSLLERLRPLVDQFTGRHLADAYWHPILEERRAALLRRERMSP